MGSIAEDTWLRADSVAIIGAGPSGLAVAKYLIAERAFSKIQIFEQRATVGGIWNYVPFPEGAATRVSSGNLSRDTLRNRGLQTDSKSSASNAGPTRICDDFLTPLYDRLETNIPRDLMGFSDLDWPHDSQLFPRHETVLEYIEHYAEDVRYLISFCTKIVSVRPDGAKWHIDSCSTQSGEVTVQHQVFDAVIVASGHFDVPYMPDVPGMAKWASAYPGSISHSKYYRTPDRFANKKVIVVGNSASGIDIGAQIRSVCKAPLIASTRSASYLQAEAPQGQRDKPAISEYVPQNRTVIFADGSQEQDVDAVLYCTGYFYSFPFLKGLEQPVITTGERVENLYQHLFYRPAPTLMFPTLNQKIIPFPFAEAQGAVIARVLAGRLSLPSRAVMERWEQATLAEMGAGRDFHVLKFPKDANYINMMHDWTMSARDIADCPPVGDVNGGCPSSADGLAPTAQMVTMGKRPPHWGEREYWMRERFPAIKKAFQDFGEARHGKRALVDVGFRFD